MRHQPGYLEAKALRILKHAQEYLERRNHYFCWENFSTPALHADTLAWEILSRAKGEARRIYDTEKMRG